MKKKSWLPVVLLLCSLHAFTQEDKPIITVLDFSVNEVSQAEMRSIISLLSSALFKSNDFTVIDVSQRDTVLKEMEFSMAGCSDESCMLEIGKLLSAEAIVIGSIGRVGSKYVFSSKMLETETARTLSTADGIYSDLDALLEDIFNVAAELGAPYAGKAVVEQPPEPTIEAEPETPAELTVEEAEEKEPKPVREPRPPREPGEINIPGIATLAGGAACAGTGAYFLIVSLPLVLNYFNAKTAYDEATGTALEVLEVYEAYEEARLAAIDGNANRNFIIGTSLTGVGIALATVSVILFVSPSKDDSSGAEVAFMPLPGVSGLACRIRY